jgi:hypothetical protein
MFSILRRGCVWRLLNSATARAGEPLSAKRGALDLRTPMPALHGVGGRLGGADGRFSKDQREIRSELGWVGFDDHDIVAPGLHDGLSHSGLGQQRLQRHHTAREDQRAEHCLDLP